MLVFPPPMLSPVISSFPSLHQGPSRISAGPDHFLDVLDEQQKHLLGAVTLKISKRNTIPIFLSHRDSSYKRLLLQCFIKHVLSNI